ncbi:MAG TPA: efflux RND transporter periplasmic adaptor subunit [Burkholderiaceae bacterium]|nr:efflux RND transporter periplasmic adaptor subunit [Burkholderiaceae bacterium]
MADQPITASSLSRLAIDRGAAVPRGRRALWKRWWFWAGLLVLVGAVALFIGRRNAPQPVEIATIAAAYPSASISSLNATGRVVAARRASVSSKGTGRLEWLGVQEGQRVTEGDIIARLENRDVAAQREQAAAQVQVARANLAQGQADLEDAQSAFKRAQDLAQQKFIAGSALDTAEARYNKSRAAIDTLKAQIAVAQANHRAAEVAFDQTLIRAPFSGIVLTKSANVGDIVTPFSAASGTTGAVVTMADMETLEVEADVSEASIAKISVGQPAEIQLDAFPDLRLLGEVSRIVPTVDRAKATLLVKVKFVERDPRVLPDMSAKIAFLSRPIRPDERKPVAAVRADAIVKRDGKDVVFVVGKDDQVKLTPVTTGAKVGDLVRVDLTPGTRVVATPGERLGDGAAVIAAKK